MSHHFWQCIFKLRSAKFKTENAAAVCTKHGPRNSCMTNNMLFASGLTISDHGICFSSCQLNLERREGFSYYKGEDPYKGKMKCSFSIMGALLRRKSEYPTRSQSMWEWKSNDSRSVDRLAHILNIWRSILLLLQKSLPGTYLSCLGLEDTAF